MTSDIKSYPKIDRFGKEVILLSVGFLSPILIGTIILELIK
jgi:hypothetical protein